jgi:GDP-L-fucose synthase
MYDGAKVLVAGGTGTIGIQLVNQLLSRGANVTIASLDNISKVKDIFGSKANFLNFKCLDLTLVDSCNEAVKGQEIVFNLVGIKGSTGIGETKVASYLIPMIRFQTNLMEAAFNHNVSRFLFTGSVCSYPQSELHYEENMWNGMPKQNDRIPGIAKRVGELMGEAFELEHGWDAVRVVRPSNVYGPYDDFNPRTAQIIPSLIHKALNERECIEVWGDGSAVRDFIFSEDVAYWMLEALEHAPSNYPINLGSGRGVTIKETAESIIKLVNPSLGIKWKTDAPTGDPIRVLSVARAREVLGFLEKTTLVDGLSKTINWYQAYSHRN